jgi:hypothetical protein
VNGPGCGEGGVESGVGFGRGGMEATAPELPERPGLPAHEMVPARGAMTVTATIARRRVEFLVMGVR